MKIEKILIGVAGEHLVLSRSFTRGILASLVPRGARKVDILVNPLNGGKPLLIQVKTRSGAGEKKRWAIDTKHKEMLIPIMYFELATF